ncbi:MAG: outer membrane protein assembly factor BamC [Candidatus Nitrotoga sp.]
MRIQQRPAFLLLILLELAGCGTIGLESKRIDYKAAAVKTIPLEVPPDLTAPTSAGQFIIPNNGSNTGVENGTSFSQFSRETATPIVAALPVLPIIKDMHIERSGRQRWLVVNDKAEKLWPSVHAFWQ